MDFNGKTLYVTDLDGTLMKNDETVSAETVRIINELVKRGLADNATGIIGSNEEDAVARFLQEHSAKGLAFSVEK
jgi:hydroxymethylpyrimidine pyrophosphatase-like HAD family hydrolase